MRGMPASRAFIGHLLRYGNSTYGVFVLLLAQAIVTEDLYEEQDDSTFETGVQAQVEAYNQATAENLVRKQFTSAPVDPTVFDIIEEDRTNEVQPDEELKQKRNTGTASTNAIEIVEQRFASEIARGSVEIREEESKIIVEVDENNGEGTEDLNEDAKLQGEVNDQLLELYLQVATAQAETGATIEVLGGSPRPDDMRKALMPMILQKFFRTCCWRLMRISKQDN